MIHLKNVHKSYVVKDKQIPALNGIDLSIVRGEIFGVIGHSGAGKSTLIRLINLLERPSGGDIIVDGEAILAYDNLALRNFRRNIGMIFQHFQSAELQDGGRKCLVPHPHRRRTGQCEN